MARFEVPLMTDDLTNQALRALVERYRRSVHAMSAQVSADVAVALANALRAVERARTRETLSDDLKAESALGAVRKALDSLRDPF